MSFDINGNKLQPGHCEVHPHINEDYPCSVCNSEHYRKVASSEQQGKWKAQDELAALSARLNKTIDDKSKHIKELENRIKYLLMQNWQGHHIFKMDGLLDGLKQRDLENTRKGFWLGFEDARCHPDEMNIKRQWENTLLFRQANEVKS
jgi:hypothetical protein